MKSPLSLELKIACEIYKHNITASDVWTGKLARRFKKEGVSKEEIVKCIDTLFDWSIIKVDYVLGKNGKERRSYHIASEAIPLIRDLYKRYWIRNH